MCYHPFMFRSRLFKVILLLPLLAVPFVLGESLAAKPRKPAVAGKRMVVLRSLASETSIIEGTASEADRRVCPASTFKILIAWAALEEGVASPGRLLSSNEAHVPGTPRQLDLQHALVLSSNAYFDRLVAELGRHRLETWIARSGLFPLPLPRTWIGKDLSAAVHGGKLLVTARSLHELMKTIATSGLGTRPDVRETFPGLLEWPSPDPAVRVYGKTGVYGGAVWFTGFGDSDGRRTTVTVFQPGTIADRPGVIARFYREFGVAWSPALIERW